MLATRNPNPFCAYFFFYKVNIEDVYQNLESLNQNLVLHKRNPVWYTKKDLSGTPVTSYPCQKKRTSGVHDKETRKDYFIAIQQNWFIPLSPLLFFFLIWHHMMLVEQHLQALWLLPPSYMASYAMPPSLCMASPIVYQTN